MRQRVLRTVRKAFKSQVHKCSDTRRLRFSAAEIHKVAGDLRHVVQQDGHQLPCADVGGRGGLFQLAIQHDMPWCEFARCRMSRKGLVFLLAGLLRMSDGIKPDTAEDTLHDP